MTNLDRLARDPWVITLENMLQARLLQSAVTNGPYWWAAHGQGTIQLRPSGRQIDTVNEGAIEPAGQTVIWKPPETQQPFDPGTETNRPHEVA
jgi:hypothetical protein